MKNVLRAVPVLLLLMMPALAQAQAGSRAGDEGAAPATAAVSGHGSEVAASRDLWRHTLAPTQSAVHTAVPSTAAAQVALAETRAVSVVLQQDRRRGLTYVLVGGALIAAGLLIDGDAGAAVSVGGAVLGAYGVFLMVRR